MSATEPPVPVLRAALACRCPRCGRGHLYEGLLTIRGSCPVCGLDFTKADPGDGVAAGAIMVLGAVVVALAFWVEFRFNPSLWVHAILWPAITIPAAIAIIRPAKAALIALQFRYRAHEMGL